jgi:hypothetical protein
MNLQILDTRYISLLFYCPIQQWVYLSPQKRTFLESIREIETIWEPQTFLYIVTKVSLKG